MSSEVRVGLMGCGRIAQFFHLSILGSTPGAKLSAIAEMSDDLRRQAQAAAPDAKPYSDYKQMLADESVDAVVVCLPTGMHARAAVDAFEAGKHVYLEKPIGITLKEAARVVEAEKRSGKSGMIGFNYRFHPLHKQLKSRIGSGEIGNVVAVRSSFCAAKRELPGWKQKRDTGGGVLLDLGTHHADLARFIFDDEVVGVSAAVRQMNYEGDFGSMRMHLGSGLVWDGTFSSQASDTDTIEVLGDKGMLRLDRYAGSLERNESKPGAGLVKRGKRALGDVSGLIQRTLSDPGEPSFKGALSAWVNALGSASAMPATLIDGMRSLSVICAAEQSAEQGGAVIDPRQIMGAAESGSSQPAAGALG